MDPLKGAPAKNRNHGYQLRTAPTPHKAAAKKLRLPPHAKVKKVSFWRGVVAPASCSYASGVRYPCQAGPYEGGSPLNDSENLQKPMKNQHVRFLAPPSPHTCASYLPKSPKINESQCKSTKIYENQRKSTKIYENQRKSKKIK